MKANKDRKISLIALCLVLMFLITPRALYYGAYAEETDIAQKVNAAYDLAASYIYSTVQTPDVGSVGGEWAIIGLSRGEYAVEDEYYADYYNRVRQYITEKNGILSEKKYTEYSRVILALTSIGIDARNAAGYDLVKFLAETENVTAQGINGAVFALIALDCGDYIADTAEKTAEVKNFYINEIVEAERSDGGWSFSTTDGASDIDLTAMVLQALSKHRDDTEVYSAIQNGLTFLSENQLSNGGYMSYGDECSESCAQVIVALSALGIAPDDDRFVKNGNTVTDALLGYMRTDGSFVHTMAGDGENLMASEQALYALAAQKRFLAGETALYDMTDTVSTSVVSDDSFADTLIEKHPIVSAGKTFGDISDIAERDKIETLAERGIINGKSDSEFDPFGGLTRAEFAAIAVRILCLTELNEKTFDDVNENDWFFTFAATAKQYGIINGVSETEFNPSGGVTREEAACMIERCAALCGADTDMSDTEIRDTLSAFTDYISVADWAKKSLAFCFNERLISDEETEINPRSELTRAETAVMFYNLAMSY